MQKSNRRSGSAIIALAWWSSTVIGTRKRASGLFAAMSRALIATSAKCSVVVPYFDMCRRAASANICPGDCSP